eukprot:scaffold29926_cov138-Skeletonema_marinoi.AAC.6
MRLLLLQRTLPSDIVTNNTTSSPHSSCVLHIISPYPDPDLRPLTLDNSSQFLPFVNQSHLLHVVFLQQCIERERRAKRLMGCDGKMKIRTRDALA